MRWNGEVIGPRRLLAVEDETTLTQQWARMLQNSESFSAARVALTPAPTVEAARAALAVAWSERRFYRYVLLDLRLPDGNGLSLLPDLACLSPRPSIAVISGLLDLDLKLELWHRSVPAFDKPVSPEHLHRVVVLLEDLYGRTPGGFLEHCRLSLKEAEVAALVLNGLTHKEIADRCGIKSSTVRTYCKRICTKAACNTVFDLHRRVLRWCLATPAEVTEKTMNGRRSPRSG